MQKNIIEYLENTAQSKGDNTAISDGDRRITFSELLYSSRSIASALLETTQLHDTVMICMEKSIEFVETMLGCAQAGIVYIPVDNTTPVVRLEHIIKTAEIKFIICREGENIPEEIVSSNSVIYVEELKNHEVVMKELKKRRNDLLVTDPLYMIFTSGSTGKPKGIITSHLALISFIDAMVDRFPLSSEDALANQVPFYFDASTKDIFIMCKCGCTMHIIPKKLFMLPRQLIEFLNEKHITTVIWAPSLLCFIANFHTLEKVKPQYLQLVFFVGEQMPAKQMNMWRDKLPEVQFVNLYGSTEVSGSSAYYIIDRKIEDTEIIPIGIPFSHMELFLLDDENTLIRSQNTIGEICVRGPSLSLGYYNDIENSKLVFLQNPLNSSYSEIIYRSGDLGKYNSYNELVYVCRKDYQIKRMGHRIELGEIEAVISSIKGIDRVCCIFNEQTQGLLAIFSGSVKEEEIKETLRNTLPSYMLPSEYHIMENIPLNMNGKIDRSKLKTYYLEKEKQ